MVEHIVLFHFSHIQQKLYFDIHLYFMRKPETFKKIGTICKNFLTNRISVALRANMLSNQMTKRIYQIRMNVSAFSLIISFTQTR